MPSAIDGLKPEPVWKVFEEISGIPRGSKNEAAIAAYVVATAKRLGLAVKQDRAGNVAVKKGATASRPNSPSVCLQGHLDMVCEKNADKVHDFTKDPIELVRKGNVLAANGTTLGADNGIAVATNLALMKDMTLAHGPLEFLFTIDEETGLTGATNLSPDLIESKTLLNLDSEEEGSIYVGCSGGRDTVGTFPVKFENRPPGSVSFSLAVSGLKGGHSGLEIDKNRGNAVKILNRVLLALEKHRLRLSSIDGGNKRNAIPRECTAFFWIPKKAVAAARRSVSEISESIRAEFSTLEPALSLSLTEAKGGKVFPAKLQGRILRAISGLPHGVTKMSSDIPGLVETSTNVASVATSRKALIIATSQRSSVESENEEMCDTVASVLTLAGAEVKSSDGYPGWKPNLNSPILKVARETYSSLFGKEPEVKAIHAGLECGIIGERIPGMDMVSFGPTLEGVHSPDEKIYTDTVERFWNFLVAILAKI